MTILEKTQMKEIVWELMQENKAFFKEIITQIIIEEKPDFEGFSEENNREERVKNIIKNDFKRYENVFKTLA